MQAKPIKDFGLTTIPTKKKTKANETVNVKDGKYLLFIDMNWLICRFHINNNLISLNNEL